MLRVVYNPAMSCITGAGTGFKKGNDAFVDRIKNARSGLLTSLNPGELSVSILPARAKVSDDTAINAKLIVFQVNVALYPASEFMPQSMSVQLSVADSDVQ